MAMSWRLASLALALSVTACGTYVPEMQEFNRSRFDQTLSELELVQQIRCEIAKGSQETWAEYQNEENRTPLTGYAMDWFKTWQAKASLKMSVDEKGAITPGLTVTDPWFSHTRHGNPISRSFSLAANVKGSSQATRTETVGFDYKIADFLKTRPFADCKNSKSIMADDLKIGDFIKKKALLAVVPNTVGNDKGSTPFNAFNYQVTFVAIYGANANPVWKLVDITTNNAGPLLDISRTKTHDLTITMGPVEAGKPPAFNELYLATLIGQAVARELDGRRTP